jgi:threonine aldolase
VIDLRSDTATVPTEEMRAAMAVAEVGDEQLREDPTVNELQRRAAALLGQEAALFLPTATMANQIALKVLTKPGCVLVAEERTHILIFEAGGPAIHSGLVMLALPGEAGRISPAQIEDVAARSEDVRDGSVVVLENTHRSAGGRVWPLETFREVARSARDGGFAVHLDGARIMNAAVAAGLPAAEYGSLADSVTLCFSKGLGCPLGAILASSEERIERAWREKFLFGGAMRQAGMVAAAALYALDHHVERLADDHRRARNLAEGLAGAGLSVHVDAVETNFVGIEAPPSAEADRRLLETGVRLGYLRPGVFRAATYLGVTDEDVEHAVAVIPETLGTLARA